MKIALLSPGSMKIKKEATYITLHNFAKELSQAGHQRGAGGGSRRHELWPQGHRHCDAWPRAHRDQVGRKLRHRWSRRHGRRVVVR